MGALPDWADESLSRDFSILRLSYYNLDTLREAALSKPLDRTLGAWCVTGFIDEWLMEAYLPPGKPRTVRFYNFTGWGGVFEAEGAGPYDYYSFPVVGDQGRTVSPEYFNGMSGGGLWQVPLTKSASSGTVGYVTPILSGVVFYQVPTTATECGVRCHGPTSLYGAVYDAIKSG